VDTYTINKKRKKTTLRTVYANHADHCGNMLVLLLVKVTCSHRGTC